MLSGHSKRRPKAGFQDRLSLNVGQKYCRMLQESILQYFRPSLSYHLSLRPLFCLFLSGGLRQVLLCIIQLFCHCIATCYAMTQALVKLMPRSHIRGSPRRFYYGLNLTDDRGNANFRSPIRMHYICMIKYYFV